MLIDCSCERVGGCLGLGSDVVPHGNVRPTVRRHRAGHEEGGRRRIVKINEADID